MPNSISLYTIAFHELPFATPMVMTIRASKGHMETSIPDLHVKIFYCNDVRKLIVVIVTVVTIVVIFFLIICYIINIHSMCFVTGYQPLSRLASYADVESLLEVENRLPKNR